MCVFTAQRAAIEADPEGQQYGRYSKHSVIVGRASLKIAEWRQINGAAIPRNVPISPALQPGFDRKQLLLTRAQESEEEMGSDLIDAPLR
jgi:hypothetical protein